MAARITTQAVATESVHDLQLMPFLSACPSPAVVLPVRPLAEALQTRNSIAGTKKQRSSAGEEDADYPPREGGDREKRDEGDVDEASAVLAGLVSSLQPEWANDAWHQLQRAKEGQRWSRAYGGEALGKPTSVSEDVEMAFGGSSRGSPPPGGGGQLNLLSAEDQRRLLSCLLDILNAAEQAASSPTARSVLRSAPPPSSVFLPSLQLTLVATLVPTDTHVILMATSTAPPTSNTIRNVSPFLISGRRPSTAPSTPLIPPPLPHKDNAEPVDPYLASLGKSQMANRIRDYPWETTSLGPIEDWCPELKSWVTGMLASPFREAILYGDDHVLLYNDRYIVTAGSKHPFLLGKPGAIGWDEIWEGLGPVAARVMQGEMVHYVDHALPMLRKGYLEETYHSFSYVPFRSSEGKVLGFSNVSFETTDRVIAERRLETVRDLIQKSSMARTVSDFCNLTVESLSTSAFDIPFGALYTCQITTTPRSKREVPVGPKQKPKQTLTLKLRGTVGIPTGHPFAPSSAEVDILNSYSELASSLHDGSDATAMDVAHAAPQFAWPFDDAVQSKDAVSIDDLGEFTKTLEQRGWGDLPRQGVVLPIMLEADQKVPSAFLVLGINPRGVYDDLHRTFHALLSRHIATGLLTVTNAEADARRTAELTALDQAKTLFFNNVSHELRTPLSLVLGPLDDVLTETDALGPNNRTKLTVVKRHANRLLSMVNKLLDFSSIEGGRMQMTFRPTKLGPLTRDLAALFKEAIERGNIKFIVRCEDDPPEAEPIYMAVEMWEKVIMNLLGNSLKYCPAGEIEITLEQTQAEATLSVRDTGIGIPRDELSRIFERFHRVNSAARTTSGTGIGLALTLEVVKSFGGQLDVESDVGVGSIFRVRLNRGFTHLPKAQVVHESESAAEIVRPTQRTVSVVEEAASWRYDIVPVADQDAISSASSSSGSGSGSGSGGSSAEDFLASADLLNFKNSVVVLAEDSADLRNYITGLLSKAFTVVGFPDGQAALEYSLRRPPSLIVSDMTMPRLDGRGLLAAIRANPSTTLIPVIFLSAQAGIEARAEALESGADDYLVKPFQARELIARVNVHLQLGKMRSELERRVAERTKALVDSEVRYRGLADRYSTLSVLSPVGIFLTDSRGVLSYANPRWYEISGHPPKKPLSEWRDNVIDEDRLKVDAVWDALIAAGPRPLSSPAEHVELRFKRGVWAQFDMRAFADIQSKDGFVGCITDITHQKKVEALHIQTVEQRAIDAEETKKQQEKFIDMSSHELRNPLSGVWQNAEVVGTSLERFVELLADLHDGEIPDRETIEDMQREMHENTEAIESIMLCASHQGRIADDILNVSKLNMGLLSVQTIPFELVTKMSEVLRMFEVECQQKQIALTLAKGSSLKELRAEWIVADPSRLAQILINFLTNSVKYTSDAVQRRITVHLEALSTPPPLTDLAMRVSEPEDMALSGDQVWVSIGVEDTGKGLSRQDLQKLFERFSQANPKSDQYGGAGLGLYVSKKLVELHHGFIEVESMPNQGSTFRFAIPAERTKPSLSATMSPPLGTTTLIPSRGKRPSTSAGGRQVKMKVSPEPAENIHVLVVEDNLINQKVLQRQLKMEKFTVSVANHGQEALDLLDKERTKPKSELQIRIILMDIEMPVMDGLTAIKELRRRESTGELPKTYSVIAVTGNARQGQIDQCLEAGFNDVAIKPYRMPELLAQIYQLCRPSMPHRLS